MITTARVDDIDGREITYKMGDHEYNYVLSSTVAYWNMSDLTPSTGVSEGDYVVLIDSDDDGRAIDHVIVVTDEDVVEEEEYDMTSFLSQFYKTAQSLKTEERNITMKTGEKLNIEIVADYADGTNENVTKLVEWVNSKSSIVSVKNGQLVAKKAGKATIKVRYQSQELSLFVTVE